MIAIAIYGSPLLTSLYQLLSIVPLYGIVYSDRCTLIYPRTQISLTQLRNYNQPRKKIQK